MQNFILGISGVLLATMLLLFSLQTTINLEAAFKEINNRHIQNVSEIISTELTLKKTEISNILKLLESNNDLASSYLLSSETKDYSLFQSKLQAIKEKANLDFIDVISKNGKPFFNAFNVLDLLTDSFSSADYGIINGRPVLIMASPLKYFNETVGYVVAGLLLNESFSKKNISGVVSKVTFEVKSADEQSNKPLNGEFLHAIETVRDKTLMASITPDDKFLNQLKTKTNLKLLGIGAICFSLLVIILYLLIRRGFLGNFKKLVESINQASLQLDSGLVPDSKLPKVGIIKEVKTLSKALTKFMTSINSYSNKIKAQSKIVAEMDKQSALTEQARAFAHDVRSPATAIASCIKLVKKDISKEIYDAVNESAIRIFEMADTHLKKTSNEMGDNNTISKQTILKDALESLIAQKKKEYADRPITFCYQANEDITFAVLKIDELELKRVLSNLINNSVEAIEGKGTITIQVNRDTKNICLSIKDTGKGIPSNLLDDVFKKGLSFGKLNGSGLGLYGAKSFAETSGGKISISSEIEKGTEVTLHLPVSELDGFITHVNIDPKNQLVFVDDDELVHSIWKHKLNANSKLKNIKTHHFNTPKSFLSWADKNQNDINSCLFFIDFDLSDKTYTGRDLVQKLNLQRLSVLVSGISKEKLLDIASKDHLRVLHKEMLEDFLFK